MAAAMGYLVFFGAPAIVLAESANTEPGEGVMRCGFEAETIMV